jgi:hypothetical protein
VPGLRAVQFWTTAKDYNTATPGPALSQFSSVVVRFFSLREGKDRKDEKKIKDKFVQRNKFSDLKGITACSRPIFTNPTAEVGSETPAHSVALKANEDALIAKSTYSRRRPDVPELYNFIYFRFADAKNPFQEVVHVLKNPGSGTRPPLAFPAHERAMKIMGTILGGGPSTTPSDCDPFWGRDQWEQQREKLG